MDRELAADAQFMQVEAEQPQLGRDLGELLDAQLELSRALEDGAELERLLELARTVQAPILVQGFHGPLREALQDWLQEHGYPFASIGEAEAAQLPRRFQIAFLD
jgi:hypothetical protein